MEGGSERAAFQLRNHSLMRRKRALHCSWVWRSCSFRARLRACLSLSLVGALWLRLRLRLPLPLRSNSVCLRSCLLRACACAVVRPGADSGGPPVDRAAPALRRGARALPRRLPAHRVRHLQRLLPLVRACVRAGRRARRRGHTRSTAPHSISKLIYIILHTRRSHARSHARRRARSHKRTHTDVCTVEDRRDFAGADVNVDFEEVVRLGVRAGQLGPDDRGRLAAHFAADPQNRQAGQASK